MPETETREFETDDSAAVLSRWRERLDALVRDFKPWVEKAGWRTRTIEKRVTDMRLGRYHVPVLLMERDTVEVVLNPVSPLVQGAEGAVDLYVAPAYDDIAALYFEGGRWVIYYPSPDGPVGRHSLDEPESLPLTEEAANRVLNAITAHAT